MTHIVIDKMYRDSESVFEGTLEECQYFVAQQGEATFMYDIVTKPIVNNKVWINKIPDFMKQELNSEKP